MKQLLMLLLLVPWLAMGSELTLVYSGNLDGELEPCGCSEAGDLGGLRRRATLLAQLRNSNPELIVLSAGGLVATEFSTDAIKNSFIFKGMALLQYDAIGLQWADLAVGEAPLLEAGLPWVASNWLDGRFMPQRRIERIGGEMTFLQWLEPGDSPYRGMPGAQARVSEAVEGLTGLLRQARQRGDLTVVGSSLTLEQATRRLPLDLIDILLIKARYEEFGQPRRQGKTLLLQPGSRGMRLGQLQLQLDDTGAITDWRHQVIPMPNTIADASSMEAWYTAYNAEVKADYLRRVARRKALSTGQSPYLGAEKCAACHAEIHTKMATTGHAGALAKLEAVGKAFDPNCLRCHTLGLGEAGGYLDQFLTPHLANVQCESCHGAGRAHVVAGGAVAVPVPRPDAAVCGACHNASHSPEFQFQSYWPRIQHGRDLTGG